jgi:FkbM family methyltransferase
MKNYSQNQEQQAVTKYFARNDNGVFLDIGAYHPENLSNTRALVLQGWSGVFVEPNPRLQPAFLEQCENNKKLKLLPLCVGKECGTVEFLLSSGNLPWADALSTTDPTWTNQWEKAGVKFEPVQSEMVDFATLVSMSGHKHFDFISIDTENNVLEILEQIDPSETRTSLFCVEWNGTDFKRFNDYFRPRGFRELYRSAENLIYGLRR